VTTDLDAAREVHTKFEFYFVALTFTMLAFAIQTGEFHGSRYSFYDFLEGTAWVALTAAGLLGLWRLEYFPPMYRANWNRASGSTPQAEAEADQVKLERQNRIKYKLQKIAFVIGVITLTSSRLFFKVGEYY